MKIGDKVRFLSEVGGGRVSGFQGKDIVLVEDEDGFDVPMRITEWWSSVKRITIPGMWSR